jgi:hypothetical protein
MKRFDRWEITGNDFANRTIVTSSHCFIDPNSFILLIKILSELKFSEAFPHRRFLKHVWFARYLWFMIHDSWFMIPDSLSNFIDFVWWEQRWFPWRELSIVVRFFFPDHVMKILAQPSRSISMWSQSNRDNCQYGRGERWRIDFLRSSEHDIRDEIRVSRTTFSSSIRCKIQIELFSAIAMIFRHHSNSDCKSWQLQVRTRDLFIRADWFVSASSGNFLNAENESSCIATLRERQYQQFKKSNRSWTPSKIPCRNSLIILHINSINDFKSSDYHQKVKF